MLLAFAAGVLTVAAPCILPILLGASVGQTSRVRPVFITLGFVLTFSAVALVFGAFAEGLGASEEFVARSAAFEPLRPGRRLETRCGEREACTLSVPKAGFEPFTFG